MGIPWLTPRSLYSEPVHNGKTTTVKYDRDANNDCIVSDAPSLRLRGLLHSSNRSPKLPTSGVSDLPQIHLIAEIEYSCKVLERIYDCTLLHMRRPYHDGRALPSKQNYDT